MFGDEQRGGKRGVSNSIEMITADKLHLGPNLSWRYGSGKCSSDLDGWARPG